MNKTLKVELVKFNKLDNHNTIIIKEAIKSINFDNIIGISRIKEHNL